MVRKSDPKPASTGKQRIPTTGNSSKANSASPRPKPSASVKRPMAPAKPIQHALVVGVSNYPAPISKLPAVAADVRGVARVLASKNGMFPNEGVTVLTEKAATRDQVLASIRALLSGGKAGDTVFIYLAGHGGVEGGKYYYVAHDTKSDRLSETGVPLAEIKRMFERTASRRVFLWLDFCHSGGMTERGTASSDIATIKREIGVVSGQGKIIVAACTPSQYAYEDPKLGHGLFTSALLRGLKGEAKSAQGEVTALSLYEFIDHEVKHPNQQPTFFGQMAGRIVLMHYPASGSAAPAATAHKSPQSAKSVKPVAAGRVSSSGNLLLLNDRIYVAQSVREASDGEVGAKIASPTTEEEAALRSLRGDRFGGNEVCVAFGNQAFKGRVDNVAFETAGAKSVCTVTVKPMKSDNSYMSGMTYNGVTQEQQAEMRARVLLLDEKPSVWDAGRDQSLRSFALSPLEEAGVVGGIFPVVRKSWKGSQVDLLKAARLWAVHYLKSCDVCDEILELSIGPVRAGKLGVRFRGSRKSNYSNQKPHEVAIEGTSPF